MNKIIYTLFTLLLLAACNDKIENSPSTNELKEYDEIEVSFGDVGLDLTTRSFMDDVVITQDWESSFNSLRIYIFNENGKYIKDHSVSSADIQKGSTVIQMPREATGQYCTFYAMTSNAGSVNSNQYYGGESVFSQNVVCATTLKNFNGELDRMLNGEMYASNMFPMSGSAKVYVNSYGYLTEVFIPLKRLMAKVALEWRIDPDFSKNHNGGIVILDEPCLTYKNGGYTFETEEPRDNGNFYSIDLIQTPGVWDGWNHNLWYVYEGKKGEYGNDKAVILTGLFDKDGDLSTTEDQHTVFYSIPIDYITNKQIVRRNTVYRIQATIKGLGENNLEAKWEAEDWTVLPVHDYDTGL